MSFNTVANFIQPWSPVLMHSTLDAEVVKAFLEITDKILKDPESKSWGKNLAGEIKDEILIDSHLLENTKVLDKTLYWHLNQYIHFYLAHCLRQSQTPLGKKEKVSYQTSIKSCWVVSQKENEYNPVHIHTECNMSAVFYLKIPNYTDSRKNKAQDGAIIFFGGDPGHRGQLRKSYWGHRPVPGDLFIFPSDMAHMVHPFRVSSGDPERRSVSFNIQYQTGVN